MFLCMFPNVSLVHFYMHVGGKVACLLCVEIVFHTPLEVFFKEQNITVSFQARHVSTRCKRQHKPPTRRTL